MFAIMLLIVPTIMLGLLFLVQPVTASWGKSSSQLQSVKGSN